MSFRIVYELSHLDEKKCWSIFSIKASKPKNAKKNDLFSNDNSYTIRKPMSNLVDFCCFKNFIRSFGWKKNEKYENDEFWLN
jgi:hypothetical protein